MEKYELSHLSQQENHLRALNVPQLWGQAPKSLRDSVTWWYLFAFQRQVGSLALNPFTACEGADLFSELLYHSQNHLFLTLLGQ